MTTIGATPTRTAYAAYGTMSTAPSPAYSAAATTYASDSWQPSLGSDSPIGLVSSVYASSVAVGAVTAAIGGGSTMGAVSSFMDKFGKGFTAARSGLASTTLVGAVVGGGFSLVTNAIDVARGRTTLGAAAGHVVRDTASATVSSIGATLVGGAATAALGAVGIVGLPLTIAGLGISVLAGVAIDAAFRRSVGNKLSFAVAGALDK
jgi:hypothetical protein